MAWTIDQLTDRQRRIVELAREFRSREDMANDLGCSVATIARELKFLRDQLDEAHDEHPKDPDIAAAYGALLWWPNGASACRDDAKLFGVSKSTVHRRNQKEYGDDDPIRDALGMAKRAVRRAHRLLEANDWKATQPAWAELKGLEIGVSELRTEANSAARKQAADAPAMIVPNGTEGS